MHVHTVPHPQAVGQVGCMCACACMHVHTVPHPQAVGQVGTVWRDDDARTVHPPRLSNQASK